MPDTSDLQINVRTTADLSGLKDLQTQIATINGDIAKQLASSGATAAGST